MTKREWNLVKEAVCRTRYECGDKVAPPGPDSWRTDYTPGNKVTLAEAGEIREYVRKLRG